MDRLIAAQQRENDGRYPETIAVVLWGTDNIKTYGTQPGAQAEERRTGQAGPGPRAARESLAQVLWMVGVRPVPDAQAPTARIRGYPRMKMGSKEIRITHIYMYMCVYIFMVVFHSFCLKTGNPRQLGQPARTFCWCGVFYFCFFFHCIPPCPRHHPWAAQGLSLKNHKEFALRGQRSKKA